MITVVLPALDEEDRLPPTLREIEEFNCETGLIHRVIVVDDGSHDATVERSRYFMRRLPIEFVVLPVNKGKWAAIDEGLKRAYGLVLLMDADGSASIRELGNLQEFPVRKEIVCGSRFMKGSKVVGKSFLRGMVSKGYRMFVRVMYRYAGGKEDIDDMQCPWKLFWKEDVQLPLLSKRFAGDLEFMCRLDAKVKNHPVLFIHKKGGAVRLETVWQMAVETVKIAMAMRLLKEKRKVYI